MFSGVGKREDEIEYALTAGILMFNVESLPELQALNEVAGKSGKKAPISIRVNPDIDPKDPSLYFHRVEEEQIRDRYQPGAHGLSDGFSVAPSADRWNRLPYRVPVDAGRTLLLRP